jgi:hypothetical protein
VTVLARVGSVVGVGTVEGCANVGVGGWGVVAVVPETLVLRAVAIAGARVGETVVVDGAAHAAQSRTTHKTSTDTPHGGRTMER